MGLYDRNLRELLEEIAADKAPFAVPEIAQPDLAKV